MGDETKVIVVGADGRVRSATGGAGALLGGDVRAGAAVDDVFEARPELLAWLAEASNGAGDRCVVDGGGGASVEVRFASLDGDGGYALVAAPAEPPPIHGSLVSQQAWHDIKNQLGGLKLYATFLKMKLASQDEMVRDTTAKIIGGIDAVVRSIAEVRRGPEQTKGEDA
jgi:hypothetical protein